jgi:hypothetical protein
MFLSPKEISFRSEQERQVALYDACLLIVNTYNQQNDMLDGYDDRNVTSYDFMTFARRIINNYEGI